MLTENADQRSSRNAAQAELWKRAKAERKRAAEADLDCGGGKHQRRRQLHVAGAAQDRRTRLHQPRNHGAAEEDIHVAHRLVQHASASAEKGQQIASECQHHDSEGEAEADGDHQRMQRQRRRAVVVACAERACDRRRDAAAHRAAGHRHRHHDEREHQRHRRERLGAEPADIGGLGDHHGHACAERKRIRRRHLQQPRQDRIVEQRIVGRRRGGRRRLVRGRNARRLRFRHVRVLGELDGSANRAMQHRCIAFVVRITCWRRAAPCPRRSRAPSPR